MLRDNDLQNMIADFPGIRQQLQVRFAPHLSACVHLSVCLEHLKLSMPSYVDDLYQKWKSCMSDTTEPNTAFPPGQQNSFHDRS